MRVKSATFMTLHIKIFIIEAQNCSEMLVKLPLKSTKSNLDQGFLFYTFSENRRAPGAHFA